MVIILIYFFLFDKYVIKDFAKEQFDKKLQFMNKQL